MTRDVPPQRGHRVTSNSNAGLIRCAQVSCVGSAAFGSLGRFGRFEVAVCVVRYWLAQVTDVLALDKKQHFRITGNRRSWHILEQAQHLVAIAQIAAGQFSYNEGMHQHLAAAQQRIIGAQVVDPR